MEQHRNSELECGRCKEPIAAADRFCRNCGSIFADGFVCTNHGNVEAEGVCVIFAKPFCKKCGGSKLGVFLCDEHYEYEIQEGRARVFGCLDNVKAQYVSKCLKQAGYHPFLLSRNFNPGPDIVTLTNVRNFGNHPIEELKVFLPYAEILKAEKTLEELGVEE